MTELKRETSGEALHELFREVFALHAALSGVMDEVHEESGLTTPQRKISEILSTRGQATVPDIAAAMDVSRQFVQTVCNGLTEEGLLEFRENPRHKRSKLAELTAPGRRRLEDTRRSEADFIGNAFHDVSAESARETAVFIRSLRGRIDEGWQQGLFGRKAEHADGKG